MHAVWARILAGEVTRPGAFSLRTLAVVKMMTPPDAELFSRFCTFVWLEGSDLLPIILDLEDEPVVDKGITYESLLHLQSLGLINLIGSTGLFSMTFTAEEGSDFSYFGKSYSIAHPHSEIIIEVGKALLTTIGKELMPVAEAQPSHEYRALIVQHWRKQGLHVIEHESGSS
jgi:hypothetical protein